MSLGRKEIQPVGTEFPHLFELDLNTLHFTETGQSTQPYLGVRSAILAYLDSRGEVHVLDGHHRVLHARSLGDKKIMAIVMSEDAYLFLKEKGVHPARMLKAFARFELLEVPRLRIPLWLKGFGASHEV